MISFAGFCIVTLVSASEEKNATLTNLAKCKLTHLGTEYMGTTMTTVGGIRCQLWYSEQPLHKVSNDIQDTDFPERSMRIAKNYCRNPSKDPRGPWCYSMEPTLIDDVCEVPLCNYGECRISGTGAEYGGSHKTGSSGRACKSWDKRHKIGNTKTEKFPNNRFSDLTRSKAKHFCRNPDDSTGGPWCYVEEDNYNLVEKEHCSIPFCDDKDCLVYVRNASVYSTITNLNASFGNITLWIKLWNPSDEQKGEARLLLSLLPIPTSAKIITQEWRAGVEIVISNAGSGQAYPRSYDEPDMESTPNIILGSKWTALWVSWGGGYVSVGHHGSIKPIFLDEFKKKKTISSLYDESFLYYGLMGTGVLWSMEFCEETCEVHTTFGIEFLRVFPLVQSNISHDLQFHLRASHNAVVRLYQSPGAPFPRLTIMIGEGNTTSVIYQENEASGKSYLKHAATTGILDFWKWHEFTVSVFGSDLRMFWQRDYGKEEIFHFAHYIVGTMRWFSMGSEKTIAHWTLSCTPTEYDEVEEPWPPNCITNLADYSYHGSQWTTENGAPCIPWISKKIPEENKKDELFPDGSALKALNKCRNPTEDPKGPFCFAFVSDGNLSVSKQYCPVRNCRSSECRMAGTANDYIGTLSTTRSGRSCAPWVSDLDATSSTIPTAVHGVDGIRAKRENSVAIPGTTVPGQQDIKASSSSPDQKSRKISVHKVDPAYLNDTLYPEHSAVNASNYCRDPSRNIGGTWCYTTDPEVPQDLCDVRDCVKEEECTFLVRGHGVGRRLYVLPEYRTEGLHFALKEWEPDHPDSITFTFTAEDGLKSRYILKIGAMDNEKILLYYESEDHEMKLVKKKTLPHLLYLGKWSKFVVRLPRGRVEVYYEGAPHPLFDWEHPELAKAFVPIYYYYTSEHGYTIGVAFDCTTRCHIENTKTERFTRILPLSMWETEPTPRPNKLALMLRGEGVILIPMILLPTAPGYYGLTVGELGQWIFFIKNTYPDVVIFHKQKAPGPLFTTDSWTNITIWWYEYSIKVMCNGSEVFHYEHKTPLLFYFFSLAVDVGGWATWTANCVPTDIDGPPKDGGWSEWGPWTCSVSCDGGTGFRKRLCNAPEPNVRGEPCLGPGTSSGRCNMNVCGDISDDTIKLIKRKIRRNYTAFTVKEGRAISILSDPDVIESVTTESPDAEINWSHNGIFIEEEEERIVITNYDIIISSAILNDSGIYTITLHRVDKSHQIFKIVSLAVEPVRGIVRIRETLPFSVTCHCIVLGYVYSDINVYWTVDGKIWKDYGTTLPVSVNIDHIPAANKSHRGRWKCIAEQSDLSFKWTTNMITIDVIGSPNWRTNLMEDKLTRPIFGWMPNETFVAVSALLLFLLISFCIFAVSVMFIRFRESLIYKNVDESQREINKASSKKSLSDNLTDSLKHKVPTATKNSENDSKKENDERNEKQTDNSKDENLKGDKKVQNNESVVGKSNDAPDYKVPENKKDNVNDEKAIDESESGQYKVSIKKATDQKFMAAKDPISKKKTTRIENSTSYLEDERRQIEILNTRDNSPNESANRNLIGKLKSETLSNIKVRANESSNEPDENFIGHSKRRAVKKRKGRKNKESGNRSENEKLITDSDTG